MSGGSASARRVAELSTDITVTGTSTGQAKCKICDAAIEAGSARDASSSR